MNARKILVLALAVLVVEACQAGGAAAFDPPIAVGREIKQRAEQGEGGGGPSDKGDGEKKGASATGLNKGPDEKVRYEVDGESARNQISFTSRTPAETFTGKTKSISGWVELNPRNVMAGAEGEFKVPWSDIETGKKMRDQHMRSSPWVDAGAHPDIVFKVTGVEESKLQKNNTKATLFKVRLTGTMSMNGREQEMNVPVTLSYVSKKGAVKEALAIKGSFKVALEDFGIEGKTGSVGTSVAKNQDIKVSVVLPRVGGGDEADEAEPTKPKPEPKPKPKPRPKGI